MILLDPGKVARYVNKANIVTAAWRDLFGGVPTKKAVILSMSVAEFETHLGDAGGSWKGEHNWGAVHKRSLTQGEAAALAAKSIVPTDGEPAVASARAILAPTAPDEALHIDDSPHGKYFVWFWAFASHVEACKKFLTTLIANRTGVRAVIDSGTPADVARAMYQSKYFSGVHKDDEANIADYAKNVADKALAIESALSMAGWDPAHAGEPLDDPSTARVLEGVAIQKASEAAHAATHGFGPFVVGGLVLGGLALTLVMLGRSSDAPPAPAGAA